MMNHQYVLKVQGIVLTQRAHSSIRDANHGALWMPLRAAGAQAYGEPTVQVRANLPFAGSLTAISNSLVVNRNADMDLLECVVSSTDRKKVRRAELSGVMYQSATKQQLNRRRAPSSIKAA